MGKVKINIIAAVATNGAIGRDNGLIWHISEDLKYFKSLTTGHPVIMGRKTFESIGRALPGRLNIVVSRGNPPLPEGVVTARSVEEAVRIATEASAAETEVFVIGGAMLYASAMDIADTLYITRVHVSPEDADAFFPVVDERGWKLVSGSELKRDGQSGYEYRHEVYVREQG